jgi:ribosome-binding factor A
MARPRDASPSQRPLRVGEALRRALIETLARAHFRDPDLQDLSLTVSEVRVSPDLRQATAYVLPLAGRDNATVLKALKRASAYLRSEVARAVTLRHAPELRFQLDTSFDYAAKIGTVLAQDHVRQDLPPPQSTPRRARRRKAKDDEAEG